MRIYMYTVLSTLAALALFTACNPPNSSVFTCGTPLGIVQIRSDDERLSVGASYLRFKTEAQLVRVPRGMCLETEAL